MTKISDCRIADLMLERIDQDPHRVLKSNTARFLANATKNYHSFRQVLLNILEDGRGSLDEFMVKDLALLPRF